MMRPGEFTSVEARRARRMHHRGVLGSDGFVQSPFIRAVAQGLALMGV